MAEWFWFALTHVYLHAHVLLLAGFSAFFRLDRINLS